MEYATGNRLKKIAEELFEGNQSELARKLNMKPQALRKYLKGESMPGGLILIRLYETGVNINWFLTGEGEMLTDENRPVVSEFDEDYLARIKTEITDKTDQVALEEIIRFSNMLKELGISSTLQRALLAVYIQHIDEE